MASRRRQDCGTRQPPSPGLSTFSRFHVLLKAVLFCERAVKLVTATLKPPTHSRRQFVQALVTFLDITRLVFLPLYLQLFRTTPPNEPHSGQLENRHFCSFTNGTQHCVGCLYDPGRSSPVQVAPSSSAIAAAFRLGNHRMISKPPHDCACFFSCATNLGPSGAGQGAG